MSEINADSLADYFAQTVTSRHNQHAMIRIVGSAGTGKSWGAIDLAYETSKLICEYVGSHDSKPKDYYSFEKHLAVMNKEDIARVMDKPDQYSILHLDDVGVPVNARKYQSEYNIEFNNIIQTFRPNHNLVIMTMQAGFLIDKVPRSLAHYEIEMEKAHFDDGFTVAKVNQIVMKHKTGKIHYPYIFINGTRYVRHIFEKPDKALTDEYERIRAEQLKRINESKNEGETETRLSKQNKDEVLLPVVLSLVEKNFSQRETAEIIGKSQAWVSNFSANHGISWR